MRKIKVGEYIRFYMGLIVKCTEWDVNHYNDFLKGKFHLCIDNEEEKIMKHSFNIMDLIEVGDYVNGYRVRGKTNEKIVVDYYCYSNELCDGCWLSFREEQIVSIVTKKVFERMEYKV